VLPAQRYVGVIGHDSSPLSLGVHKKFGPEREVVQLVWRVIDVEEKRLFVSGAGQRQGVAAMRRVRINTTSFEGEGLSAVPLAVRVGKTGVAVLFRYGVVVPLMLEPGTILPHSR
jgi:hypothetical protein